MLAIRLLAIAVSFAPVSPLVLPSSSSVHAQTTRWVETSIVGLNLCPYAKDALDGNRIRIETCEATDPEGIIDALMEEAALLLDGDAAVSESSGGGSGGGGGGGEVASTSILVVPNVEASPDGLALWLELDTWFQNFLVADEAEEDPEEQLFAGELSCAFFHPSWQFADSAADDPVNYERRSPFPLVSLLKKSDIKKLVDEGLKRGVAISEQIHNQNRERLRGLGYEKLAEMHSAEFLDRSSSSSS